jgi:hypothetical protein
VTCNGHGTVNFSGVCACHPGYAGPSCSQCAANYFDYPTCRFCTAAGSCSGQGACDATGSCVCDPDYTGSDCSACVSAVEMTCGDGEDNDCDLRPDCSDADCCGDAACAGPDADGDGVELCDCEDSNPDVWTLPGEVTDLVAASAGGGGISLVWQVPVEPGGVSVSYEVLRAWGASDFTAANPPCLQIGTLTFTADGLPVPAGGVLFYLVRAVNDCPGAGTLGRSSSNIERAGTCP